MLSEALFCCEKNWNWNWCEPRSPFPSLASRLPTAVIPGVSAHCNVTTPHIWPSVQKKKTLAYFSGFDRFLKSYTVVPVHLTHLNQKWQKLQYLPRQIYLESCVNDLDMVRPAVQNYLGQCPKVGSIWYSHHFWVICVHSYVVSPEVS